jgi:DNA-binding NtrC family response regulator
MKKEFAKQFLDKNFSLEKLIPPVRFLNKKLKIYELVIRGVEKPLIEIVLSKTRGNQLKTSRILGINRNTLHSKIKKLGISVQKWKYH